MFRKMQAPSTQPNSAPTPASARNSFFATDLLPATVSNLEFPIAPQSKRIVVQRQDSGTGGATTIAKLTQREIDVMGLLAHGLLYKEIADELGISYSAVHKHQHKIFKKLGLNNRSEATRKWLEARVGY
jgi:Response regulator containing a CheY-like receiver domain and an HTH DNA-binding domain